MPRKNKTNIDGQPQSRDQPPPPSSPRVKGKGREESEREAMLRGDYSERPASRHSSHKGEPASKRLRVWDREQEEQEEVWKEIFTLFDKDCNGRVSAAEVGTLLRALDMNPTQKEIHDIIQKIDKNGSGQIEWDEFSDFMRHLKRSTNQEMEEMMRAFMLFDHNQDGHIDAQELYRVVTRMGDKLTPDEATMMINVADINKDGRLDYTEFVKFIFAPCL